MNEQRQAAVTPVMQFELAHLRKVGKTKDIESLASENLELRRKNSELHEQLVVQGFFIAERDARSSSLDNEITSLKATNAAIRAELNKLQAQHASSKIAQIKLRHAIAITRRENADYVETNGKLQTMIDQMIAQQSPTYRLRIWFQGLSLKASAISQKLRQDARCQALLAKLGQHN